MRVVLYLAGAYLLLVGAVFFLQRKMQYFPDAGDPALPGDRGLEEVTLEAADGVSLRAWYWPGSRDVTLLLLHGNAGNRGDRLDWMARFHDLGWGVFLLDYRGYGGSGGAPTEDGLAMDADAAHAWLDRRGAKRIVLFGESVGCGVAVGLAARRPVAALVLQGSAISLVDVAKSAYPWLPVGLLMKDRYDCSRKMAAVACPALFIHGSRDGIVPPALGRALFDAAKEPKEWYPVEGAGHNDVAFLGGRAYYERVHAFLERATSPS